MCISRNIMKSVNFLYSAFPDQFPANKRSLPCFLSRLEDQINVPGRSSFFQLHCKPCQDGTMPVMPADMSGAAVLTDHGIIISPKGNPIRSAASLIVSIKPTAPVYNFQSGMTAQKIHEKLPGFMLLHGWLRDFM